MSTAVLVLFFVSAGLSVVLVGMRAGRRGPFMYSEGKGGRRAVAWITGLDAPGKLAAEVKELSRELAVVQDAEQELLVASGGGGGDFRAVAPPIMSFANGRSR